jgi:hypothetical protein
MNGIKRGFIGPVLAALLGLAALTVPHGAAWADSSAGVLFEQPALDGVDGHFIVPPAEHKKPEPGAFHIILWQPNPNRADGMLSPTEWKAGDKTGFYPSAPLQRHQEAFRDAAGASTVQIDGDTVGVYLNSNDLPGGSHKYKMMMTPEMSYAPADQVHPFVQPGRAILVTLDIQIPTAVDAHNNGSETYASADLMFVNPGRGTKISYGCNLFHNGHPRREADGHIRLDEDSQNMMVNSPVIMGNPWLTVLPGSASNQSEPWKGWKTYKFAITEQNFIAALQAYHDRDPQVSVNPADYAFAKFHLNAEMHFNSSPTELGWSMRHAKVTVVDATSLR